MKCGVVSAGWWVHRYRLSAHHHPITLCVDIELPGQRFSCIYGEPSTLIITEDCCCAVASWSFLLAHFYLASWEHLGHKAWQALDYNGWQQRVRHRGPFTPQLPLTPWFIRASACWPLGYVAVPLNTSGFLLFFPVWIGTGKSSLNGWFVKPSSHGLLTLTVHGRVSDNWY